MADFDAKSATPDSSIDAANGGVIGFDSPSSATPGVYLWSVIKSWIQSFLVYSHVSTPPGAGNDNTQGYGVGSIGIVTGTGEVYRCRDATTSAAKWAKMQTSFFPCQYQANRYYVGTWSSTQASNGVAVGANLIFYTLVPLYERVTLSGMTCRITTASAGGNFGLAVYALDAEGEPTGTPVAQSITNNSTTATGVMDVAFTSNAQLEPGVYAFCIVSDNATVAFQGITGSNAASWNMQSAFLGSSSSVSINNGFVGKRLTTAVNTYSAGAYTWPDLTGVAWTEQSNTISAPTVTFKVASVP